MAKGRVVQVIGTVVDVEFPGEAAAARQQRRRDSGGRQQDRGGGAAAPGQQLGALPGHGQHRRPAPRRRRRGHWAAPSQVPVGPATLGRLFNVLGEPLDELGEVKADAALAHPPAAASSRGAGDRRPGAGDGPQGHRPHLPLHQGRQGRRLRRRRRGQDRHHQGAHPQHRQRARRHLRLRRRRRALPRGQRPLVRDEGLRRHREDGAGLRPDERAAGRARSASASPA